jgi:hypothetical protein
MKMTDHIQVFNYPVVIFAFVYIALSWSTQRVFGCPPCARKQLWHHALLSLIMANLLCFIPLSVIAASLFQSHNDTQPRIPPEFEDLAKLQSEAGIDKQREAALRRKRLLIVFLVLAIVLCVVMFILPALTEGP